MVNLKYFMKTDLMKKILYSPFDQLRRTTELLDFRTHAVDRKAPNHSTIKGKHRAKRE